MEPAERYTVEYSARVREGLIALLAAADAGGTGVAVRAALSVVEYRLAVYPQFGEPYRNAAASAAVLWVACVHPIVVLEDSRQVWVVQPIELMRGRRV